jgi:hypothetical protein
MMKLQHGDCPFLLDSLGGKAQAGDHGIIRTAPLPLEGMAMIDNVAGSSDNHADAMGAAAEILYLLLRDGTIQVR